MTETSTPRKSSFSGGGEDDNCVLVWGRLNALGDTKAPGVILPGDVRSIVQAVKTGQITTPTS